MTPPQRLAAATAISGLVIVAVGIPFVDGWARLLLVLPLAVLIGGLGWANAAPKEEWVREVAASPVTPSHVSTFAPLPDEVEPPAPIEPDIDRAAAARDFDLTAGRRAEVIDPLQCPRCGRYRGVQLADGAASIRCAACSAELPLDRQRPTLVRTFALGDVVAAAPVDRPTIPVDRSTILIESPKSPGQSRHRN